MSAVRCAHEDELLDALVRGYVDVDLAAHVAECAACSELHLVAGAVLDDRMHAIAEAPVPSAAAVWWQVQMRERQRAQMRARRSLLIGQAATLSVAIVLMLALFGTDVVSGVASMIAAIRLSTPLLLAIATTLILGPIGGVVAIRQK